MLIDIDDSCWYMLIIDDDDDDAIYGDNDG